VFGWFRDFTGKKVTLAASVVLDGLLRKEKGRFAALNLANQSGHAGRVTGK
jgi:hypothetical protein